MKKLFLTFAPRLTLLLLLSLLIILNLSSIYYVGSYAWDDGSITLAYGKTLSENGTFSLNYSSEIVEGSSTLLLVFLVAIFVRIIGNDFYGIIAFSQILSFFFLILTIFLAYKAFASRYLSKSFSLASALLVGLMPMFTAEVMNGMEMTLFAMLFLMLIIAYEKKSSSVFLIIPLLLLTRFESVFYLGIAFFGLLIFNKQSRLRISALMLATVIFFLLLSFGRYLYFGDLLPNTIIAKMQVPYSSDGLIGMLKKIVGGLEFLQVYFAVLIGICFFAVERSFREYLLKSLAGWIAFSFLLFAFITGKNYGYAGRLVIAAYPLLVLLLADGAAKFSSCLIHINQETVIAFGKQGILVLFAICLAGNLYLNRGLAVGNLETALAGACYQNRWLPSMIASYCNKFHASNWYGITPENYRITGLSVDKIRKAMGLNVVKFVVPDIGGLGLCCDKIKVIDSALLANRLLAKNGYSVFGELIKKENVDIIETHGIWSLVSRIYDLPYFREEFTAVVAEDNLFWLNNRRLTDLLKKPGISIDEISYAQIPAKTRYFSDAVDMDYIRDRYQGKILIIKEM